MDKQTPSNPLLERRVSFKVNGALFRNPPKCVAIIFKTPNTAFPLRRAIEGSLERHFATKIQRTIGASNGRLIASRLAIDFADPGDRKIFARTTGCDSFSEIDLVGTEDDFFLLWTNRSIEISLRLIRSRDNKILWHAYHKAGRSDGGIPLSPLSVPISITRAARIRGDTEIFDSIADDAIRRMMKAFPDMRPAALIKGS